MITMFYYLDRAIELRVNDITNAQSARIETPLQGAFGSNNREGSDDFPAKIADAPTHTAYRGEAG